MEHRNIIKTSVLSACLGLASLGFSVTASAHNYYGHHVHYHSHGKYVGHHAYTRGHYYHPYRMYYGHPYRYRYVGYWGNPFRATYVGYWGYPSYRYTYGYPASYVMYRPNNLYWTGWRTYYRNGMRCEMRYLKNRVDGAILRINRTC